MTYTALALVFLGVATVIAVGLAAARRRRPSIPAVLIAAAVLVILTAVFDSIMIGAGFFHYESVHLLGVTIGLAPLEDFAYPLAGALLLPAIWTAMRARRRAVDDEEDRT
ncbi:lycopene cyclase domain-containing protein [Microbacterium sp. NPDC055903]